jgi:hypothetical protein
MIYGGGGLAESGALRNHKLYRERSVKGNLHKLLCTGRVFLDPALPGSIGILEEIQDEAERAMAFTRLWTLKEAYVKARGLGIAGVGLHNFAFKGFTSTGQSPHW